MDPDDIRGYISTIHNFRNPEIDLAYFNILEQFAWEKSLSAYQISGKLKSTASQMAYKNVNKRLHGLVSLNLIQETVAHRNNINKHNAKYYRLTEYGIYQLFLNRLSEICIRQLDIIKFGKPPSPNTVIFFRNYDKCFLFKSFLYPYFEKDTLLAIGNYLLWDLFHYLADCCHRIKDQLKNQRYDIPIINTIFCWNKVPGDDSENERLSKFLKELFNLQSVDSQHIKHDPNDCYSINIETSSASIKIKLDKDRKKVAIISTATGEWKQFEYDVSEMNSDILVGKQKPFEEYKDVLDNARNQMEQIIYGFVYDLGLSVLDSQKTEEYSYYCKILSEDKKFINMLNDIYENRHKGFERGYRMLKTYGK